MDLLEGLATFFFDHAPVARGDRLVVAFSGGGDSTALLWGLAQLAPAWGLRLAAAHLDHGMDTQSGDRAAQARDLAHRLGVPLVSARREAAGQAAARGIAGQGAAGRGPEAAARRIRYQFLEEVRRGCGARYVATAHSRDDQAETVLLRVRFGSGLRGLAGIRPVTGGGAVVRPLLGLPRALLRAAVAAAGLRPAEDPGNADPRQPRSRMRHRVLPALAGDLAGTGQTEPARTRAAAAEPAQPAARLDELVDLLARMAASAQRALPILDRRLADEIGLSLAGDDAGAAADRRRVAALPPPLLVPALALLHHRAGIAYPASRAAAAELRRQLSPAAAASDAHRSLHGGSNVGCDCGAGWRWQASAASFCLRRAAPRGATLPFTYTLEIPGSLIIPEIGATISVSERPVECMAWLRRGAPDRVVLALPPPTLTEPGGPPAPRRLTVRNRRPGDRLWPLGSPGSRKLKAVLIDRRVPTEQRDRLPLLCWGGEIAWVPGVTIGHRFRVTGEASAWLAELTFQG